MREWLEANILAVALVSLLVAEALERSPYVFNSTPQPQSNSPSAFEKAREQVLGLSGFRTAPQSKRIVEKQH